MPVADTRRRILDTALSCFLREGFEQTTIARIRERSGVSNGALFHHFPTKEAIADALYVEGIGSFQEGLWELVRSRPRSLRTAVRAAIEHQLRWIEEHPELARFVYMRGHLDWETPGGSVVAASNRELASAFRDWMAPLVRRGEIRAGPMLLITAIVSGPAHAIAQRWLAGHAVGPPTEFVDALTDAAVAGLRGRPLPARAPQPSIAREGHVKLELMSADGSVVARGQATAELVPLQTKEQNS
jgi:AcrR family transcriptional regulator